MLQFMVETPLSPFTGSSASTQARADAVCCTKERAPVASCYWCRCQCQSVLRWDSGMHRSLAVAVIACCLSLSAADDYDMDGKVEDALRVSHFNRKINNESLFMFNCGFHFNSHHIHFTYK